MAHTLEKSELALRLLDRAIKMHFDEEDPLFVMSMAHPAHLILQSLAQRAFPDINSSRRLFDLLQSDGGVVDGDGRSIESYPRFLSHLHKAPNAAKHANDPLETHVTYSEEDVTTIVSLACAHAKDLGKVRRSHLTYMYWRIAVGGIYGKPPDENTRRVADEMFPNIRGLSRQAQRNMGRQRLLSDRET